MQMCMTVSTPLLLSLLKEAYELCIGELWFAFFILHNTYVIYTHILMQLLRTKLLEDCKIM